MKTLLMGVVVLPFFIILLVVNAVLVIKGIEERQQSAIRDCNTFPSAYYHYLIPGYKIGCLLGSPIKKGE